MIFPNPCLVIDCGNPKKSMRFLRSANGSVLPDIMTDTIRMVTIRICHAPQSWWSVNNTQLVEETYCSHNTLAMFLFLLCPKLDECCNSTMSCSSKIISVLKKYCRLYKSIVLFFSFIANLLYLTGLIFIGSFKETIMAKCQTQGCTIFTTQKKYVQKYKKYRNEFRRLICLFHFICQFVAPETWVQIVNNKIY